MNDIIKNIESAQLKAEVPQFRVGDTVRVHALIKEGTVSEFRFSRELFLRNRVEAQEKLSQ